MSKRLRIVERDPDEMFWDIRQQLLGENRPRHVRIGGWREDLRDLWHDIAAEPGSHTVVAVFGVIAGALATVGFALVWSAL